MTTITKERIDLFIKAPLENGLTRGEQMELARIALASLEAEPIGAFHIADQQVGGTSDYIKDGEWPIDNGVIEVYAAPPATVVPEKLPCSVELKPGLIIGKGCKTETLLTALRRRADYYAKIDAFTPAERAEHDASIEAFKAMLPTPADSQGRPRAPVVPPAIKQDYKVIKSILPTANPDEYACCIAADMWNACRADMFQGSQPVSNRDELSSPVIPDGYALVPIVPTEDMVINGFESEPDPHFSDEKVWAEYKALSGCRRAELCWAAMIKAAPKPEGNNG
ncbi:hypothetical protein JZD35_003575 [Salmonella enterica subsp. enterica serovar Teko]|nr:hypothetical protein [Salmonella enterica subsp. enterica serovar Teko]EHE7852399.1 hypothetical protein [Salmonella enterica subsp. enterica serovar Teko]